MFNPAHSLLKRIYGVFSRYPTVARLRESYRQKIQLHYWPWYRLKPRKPGTDPSARYEHELIVSLTSFPARIHLVQYAIYSLLKQSLQPNRLVLWLGDDKFPHRENDLPTDLLALKTLGLEIRWCKDMKSCTKLLPSLREWPEALIVTADDDLYYPRDWLKSLYQSWLGDPKNIHTGGIRRIVLDPGGLPKPFGAWEWNPGDSVPAFCNTQLGCYGALYPPHCLHPDALDTNTFLRLSPSNDDFWFWAMALRNNTKIQLVVANRQQTILIPSSIGTPRLWSQNHSGGGNDRCFSNLLQAYPELLEKLQTDAPRPFGTTHAKD